MTRRAWTPRQVARLRQLAALYPREEVARRMRRSHLQARD
jgi:hypothetical protein